MAGNQSCDATGKRRQLRRVAVFCGSSVGNKPEYAQAAKDLGEEMVKRGIRLVYGGGNVGLMGIVAHTVYDGFAAMGEAEGSVLGVIPEALIPREISGSTVGEVKTVKDMHSRKAAMFEAADAFIALPGGFGTLEELLEMITWQQLGYHAKPVGVLSCGPGGGFYSQLLSFVDHAVAEGFIQERYRCILMSSGSPSALLEDMEAYESPVPVIKLTQQPRAYTAPLP